MDSVNKIEGGKGENFPAPKVGLSGEVPDDSMSMGQVGPVHGDKIVMRNNFQTFTGIDPTQTDVPEDVNVIGVEDEEGEETASPDGVEIGQK